MTIWVNQLTSSEWTAKNPILQANTLGYESDTGKHKIGDGETPWSSLSYSGVSVDDIYPVGAIYISVDATSPATLFGGTWSQFAQGRMLVGLDSTDGFFDEVEETGGAKFST